MNSLVLVMFDAFVNNIFFKQKIKEYNIFKSVFELNMDVLELNMDVL